MTDPESSPADPKQAGVGAPHDSGVETPDPALVVDGPLERADRLPDAQCLRATT